MKSRDSVTAALTAVLPVANIRFEGRFEGRIDGCADGLAATARRVMRRRAPNRARAVGAGAGGDCRRQVHVNTHAVGPHGHAGRVRGEYGSGLDA